jgi:predicted Fe-S protein YdhL (DUF1289 family)
MARRERIRNCDQCFRTLDKGADWIDTNAKEKTQIAAREEESTSS